jgi:4-hydroxy-2-oxoheptanedioate aldolase
MADLPYLEQAEIHAKAKFRAALLIYPGNFKEALRQAAKDPKKTLFGAAHGIPSPYVTKVRVPRNTAAALVQSGRLI